MWQVIKRLNVRVKDGQLSANYQIVLADSKGSRLLLEGILEYNCLIRERMVEHGLF